MDRLVTRPSMPTATGSTVPSPPGVTWAEPASLVMMNARHTPASGAPWPDTAHTAKTIVARSNSRFARESPAAAKNAGAEMRIAETWSITSTTRPRTFSGRNRTQRFSTAGWRVAQNTAPIVASATASDATSDHTDSSAPKSATATTPMSTIHTVDSAPETTKNQPHNPTDAPQDRCTLNVSHADSAGPPGTVVDQALEANTIALVRATPVTRPSTLSRICITPDIAASDSNAVATASSTGPVDAAPTALHASPKNEISSRNTTSTTTMMATGASQRSHWRHVLALKFLLLQLLQRLACAALLQVAHELGKRNQRGVLGHRHSRAAGLRVGHHVGDGGFGARWRR